MADMYRVRILLGGPYVVGGGVQELYGDVGGGSPTQFQTAVKTFYDGMKNVVLSGTTFTVEAPIEQVDAENGDIVSAHPGTGATYTSANAGTAQPPHVQGLIQWRTGTFSDGREIRGRQFIPALGTGHVTSGAPSAACITAVETLTAALIAAANSDLVVWRRPRKFRPQVGSKGDPWYLPEQSQRDGEFAPVTSGSMWTKFAVLRSRRD